MKYIALTGKIGTGKTAVAKALEAKGYILVSYTDLLKTLLANALTAIGIPTTLDDILADKPCYRALIQEFGSVIGFDLGGEFIQTALQVWVEQGKPPCVLDNIRTDAQAADVIDAGFDIVCLTASDHFRYDRIEATGANLYHTLEREQHAIEQGIDEAHIDLTLATDLATPEMIADFLAGLWNEQQTGETEEEWAQDGYTLDEVRWLASDGAEGTPPEAVPHG